MESLFWADAKAREIANRGKYHFIDKTLSPPKSFVVKTSASLSGALHIGRLSDTIRADSVVTALKDSGRRARLIWVAEDMDPLRKIPEGLPETYKKFIGAPVSDIPDPYGCHRSYSEHHTSEYLEVMERFLANKPKIFSTRREYERGNFRPFIRRIMSRTDEMRSILERYSAKPLPQNWTPWKPICQGCGKIITPRVIEAEGTHIRYRCEDYRFENTVARGCGYVGEADALRDPGKLLWKGEWATEWARWRVSSEGGGKEYEVPSSAWWINGEIAERILDYPMPVPFFYEHLFIDGKKMSASLGNVVYPREWLEVAPPELLRFLYNKKLMKTRSFSWRLIPNLYDDYDRHTRVFYGQKTGVGEKEKRHMSRLYQISQIRPPPKKMPLLLDFSFAALIAQIYDPETSLDDGLQALRRAGFPSRISKSDVEEIRQRLVYAKRWVEKYVPDFSIDLSSDVPTDLISSMTDEERQSLLELANQIESDPTADSIHSSVFNIARKHKISPGRLFRILYRLIIGRESGPRFGPLACALGWKKVVRRLREASSTQKKKKK